MDDGTVQWRRDASNSWTVRVLWALGAGTFFAAIGLIAFWRLFDLAGQAGGRMSIAAQLTPVQTILVALALALAVTILAFAASSHTEWQLERLARTLPISPPTDAKFERAMDAAVGTVVMGAIIALLMGVGRIVSQYELLAVGAGPFTLLAALTLPLALVAIVLSAFLRSVGTLDLEERTLYLHDPDGAVDLAHVESVSVRRVGDTAVVTLTYAQPDGTYVPGPRRLAMPPNVAAELQGLVGSRQ